MGNSERADNEYLKTAFTRLHDKIVSGINAGSVIDQLFAVGVIGADDYRTLCHIGTMAPPIEQCRRLMSILHTSSNPEVFVQLRQALQKEVAYLWLVDMVNDYYEQIIKSSRPETSENMSMKRQVLKRAQLDHFNARKFSKQSNYSDIEY